MADEIRFAINAYTGVIPPVAVLSALCAQAALAGLIAGTVAAGAGERPELAARRGARAGA